MIQLDQNLESLSALLIDEQTGMLGGTIIEALYRMHGQTLADWSANE